jgi:hypothetical protein
MGTDNMKMTGLSGPGPYEGQRATSLAYLIPGMQGVENNLVVK